MSELDVDGCWSVQAVQHTEWKYCIIVKISTIDNADVYWKLENLEDEGIELMPGNGRKMFLDHLKCLNRTWREYNFLPRNQVAWRSTRELMYRHSNAAQLYHEWLAISLRNLKNCDGHSLWRGSTLDEISTLDTTMNNQNYWLYRYDPWLVENLAVISWANDGLCPMLIQAILLEENLEASS